MTLRTKKGINAFNVKVYNRTTCKSALLLIMDKRLRGFKSGTRTARNYRCTVKNTRNTSISRSKKIRTATCTKRHKTAVRWQIVV